MFIKILAGLFAAAVVLLLLWSLRGVMLIPVKTGRNTEAELTLRISGSDEMLQQTLEGLLWLRDNGTLRAHIHIIAENPDDDLRHIARSYAEERKCISYTEMR